MLEIKIPKVEFDKRIILKNILLRADTGSITAITGASGSGKSTIVDILTFRKKEFYQYTIFNVVLNNFSDNELQNYLFNNIGVVYQEPQLINELTILEHISLIKGITENNQSIEGWLSILELNELLHKRPNELSGGERVRICLLLSLIKNSEILILDEPTASLDEYYTSKVLQLLKSLKNEKIIIIASHDKQIISASDRVYKIENNTLNLINNQKSAINNELFCKKEKKSPKINGVSKYFKFINKNTKIYNKFILVLTIICIGLVTFSIEFNNIATQSQVNNANKLSSNELIIYKPSGGFVENQGVENGEANEVIFQEEIEQIEKISYVEKVQWRVDLWRGGFISLADSPLYYNPLDENNKKVYEVSISLSSGRKLENNIEDYSNSTINTYSNDHNYEKQIAYDFEQKGVYISKKLAETFVEDPELLKGSILHFNLSVPVYNSDGKAWGTTESGVTYNQNLTSCKWVPVDIPIAGVLNGSSMGITNYFSYAIYMEQSEMQDYINQHKVKESRVVYLYGNDIHSCKVSIDDKPSDEKIIVVVKDEIWTPKSYSVFINDLTKIDSVIHSINKMGFNVSNEYFETTLILNSLESTQKSIQYMTLSITFIILLAYVVIKYTNQTEQVKINNYFHSLGLMSKEIHKVKKSIFLNHFLVLDFLSSVIFVVAVFFINNILKIGYTKLHLSMFLFISALCFIIEYILPLLIEKKLQLARKRNV